VPTNIQFGTDGWRAVIAETFTFDNVRLAAQASADYFLAARRGSPRLVVGYDTRFRSDRLARAVAEVLTANGIRLRPKGSQS
jgi:phosphomannomutase